MKNILKKYHKHKLITNLNIILLSLMLAFWINFLIFDWSNLSKNLKASIIDSNINNIKSDISIEKYNDKLYLISNKSINNLSDLSLTLIYNPKNTIIKDVSSNIWNIVNLSNTPWISSLILTSDKPSIIEIWDKIVEISIFKQNNTPENLNIVNANFKDINNEHFLLSTSWITF